MNKCQYCNKEFKRESTLMRHLCEPKRRWLNKDEKYVKLAFYAYNRFYKLTQGVSKEKTYDHFAKSQYYTGFTRFGKYLLNVNAVDPEAYIDYVIKGSIPLDKWSSDRIYQEYIRELNRKESADRAIERGILLMEEWSKEYDEPFNEFFRSVSAPRAVHWIRSGRISPWLIFNCDSGLELIDRLSDQELEMINDYLDPEFWNRKFSVRKDDVEFVQQVLEHAGL